MHDNLDALIVENIRIAMIKAGNMTQSNLALRTGIKKSRLSNILRGEGSFTSVELFHLAHIFGVTTEWFAREHVSEIQQLAA